MSDENHLQISRRMHKQESKRNSYLIRNKYEILNHSTVSAARDSTGLYDDDIRRLTVEIRK